MPHKSMASSLLKGLALTVGGGVALAVGIKMGQGSPAQPSSDAAGPSLEPVLDRLDVIESRMGQVESALAEAPVLDHESGHVVSGHFENRLSSQVSEIETLRKDIRGVEQRSAERLTKFGETVEDLQSRLPVLVEQTVGSCFHHIEERLHREIEETHTRTLESFVDNIQTKVVQRISAFENDLAGQAEAMNQLREYSQKTDQNMQRLLVGVDRLASEIARKTDNPVAAANVREPAAQPWKTSVPEQARKAAALVPAPPPPATAPEKPVVSTSGEPLAEPRTPEPSTDVAPYVVNPFLGTEEGDSGKNRAKWRVPLISLLVVLPLAILGWLYSEVFSQDHAAPPAGQTQPKADSAIAGNGSPAMPSAPATPIVTATGTETPIDRARGLAKSKEYAKAEEQYRSILKGDPKNREVVLGLADVLYRQQKFEESAAVLKTLSRNTP